MIVVSLRTAATLLQADPLGRDAADGRRVESWNPGGGKDRERTRWAVRACRSASKTLRTGSATGPARVTSPARSYPQPGQWRQIT
jgi:hypothetical protein